MAGAEVQRMPRGEILADGFFSFPVGSTDGNFVSFFFHIRPARYLECMRKRKVLRFQKSKLSVSL